MDEPQKLHAVVRDKEGTLWIRGRKWWRAMQGPGQLLWSDLVHYYGPLTNSDAEVERVQNLWRNNR